MATFQESIHLPTKGHAAVIDITDLVQQIVARSGVATGIANVSGVGST
ncbi:MAG TPA: secondary thiamine-phosphate synthase enzyme, partial [Solibacterales bacterium]|nr:secondary thiamine-phosphate synthase enzyme [Bryobacterales bacterium]